MRRHDSRAGRAVVHLSAAMGARFVHDAEAGGPAVCVSDPRAARVLQRALLRVLSTKCAPCVMPVSHEVAAALSGSRRISRKGGSYHLAVGLGPQGRSAFLLRQMSDKDDPETRGRKEAQMLDDLRHYLRSAPSLLAEESEDGAACPEKG